MSDYGDYDDEVDFDWLYVEETYIPADDLAEHAVHSPPPTNPLDEDEYEEWDRYDYYIDLEYGSDGYNDEESPAPEGEQKRPRKAMRKGKLGAASLRKPSADSRVVGGSSDVAPEVCPTSPTPTVLWRPQKDRVFQTSPKEHRRESFAVLPNWRDIEETRGWGKAETEPSVGSEVSVDPGSKASPDASPAPDASVGKVELDMAAENPGDHIDPDILMSILQERLAATGGPLNGLGAARFGELLGRLSQGPGGLDGIMDDLTEELLGQMGDEDPAAGLASLLGREVTEEELQDEAPPSDVDSGLPSSINESPTPNSTTLEPRKEETCSAPQGLALDDSSTAPMQSRQKRKLAEADEVADASKRTKRRLGARAG